MAIHFDKLEELLKSCGKTYNSLRIDKVVGQETMRKLKQKQEGKYIDTRTINSICKYLNCQPGDFMEYREGNE